MILKVINLLTNPFFKDQVIEIKTSKNRKIQVTALTFNGSNYMFRDKTLWEIKIGLGDSVRPISVFGTESNYSRSR